MHHRRRHYKINNALFTQTLFLVRFRNRRHLFIRGSRDIGVYTRDVSYTSRDMTRVSLFAVDIISIPTLYYIHIIYPTILLRLRKYF